jgi:uncharacterized protein (UPF0332 family)
VLEKHISVELGSAINQVEKLRLLADYTGDVVSSDDAFLAVKKAVEFVGAIKAKFLP